MVRFSVRFPDHHPFEEECEEEDNDEEPEEEAREENGKDPFVDVWLNKTKSHDWRGNSSCIRTISASYQRKCESKSKEGILN